MNISKQAFNKKKVYNETQILISNNVSEIVKFKVRNLRKTHQTKS